MELGVRVDAPTSDHRLRNHARRLGSGSDSEDKLLSEQDGCSLLERPLSLSETRRPQALPPSPVAPASCERPHWQDGYRRRVMRRILDNNCFRVMTDAHRGHNGFALASSGAQIRSAALLAVRGQARHSRAVAKERRLRAAAKERQGRLLAAVGRRSPRRTAGVLGCLDRSDCTSRHERNPFRGISSSFFTRGVLRPEPSDP